jgi:hypothetical protein
MASREILAAWKDFFEVASSFIDDLKRFCIGLHYGKIEIPISDRMISFEPKKAPPFHNPRDSHRPEWGKFPPDC